MDYEKKDFRKLYEDLVKSDWFKRAYHNKSLGECPFDIPELNESEDERMYARVTERYTRFEKYYFRALGETEANKVLKQCEEEELWIKNLLEKQKDANKAIEAVERIDKYIDEHLANAHDMKDSNPDKKYYRGWDDALGKMSGILQDVYSGERKKETLRDFIDNFPYSDEQKEQKPKRERNKPKESWLEKSKYELAHEEELLIKRQEELSEIRALKDNEQKPTDDKAFEEWIDSWWKHNKVNNPDSYDKGDEIQFDERGFKNFCRGIRNMYAWQKPAEWSEEDLQHKSWILECLADGERKMPEYAEDFRAAYNWLKSLRPQLKQEWSKGDEENFEWFDKFFRAESVVVGGKDIPQDKYLWFKSLRPQSHWKPSEEQMKALKYVTKQWEDGKGVACPSSFKYHEITELYKQIKRLM